MRIIIDTDGNADTTRISINGNEQGTCSEFSLTIRAGKKVKLQMIKEVDNRNEFLSYWGEDFKKFDECNYVKGELENNGK